MIQQKWYIAGKLLLVLERGRDSSVSKSSAFKSGDFLVYNDLFKKKKKLFKKIKKHTKKQQLELTHTSG